jgi:hypothetical protein
MALTDFLRQATFAWHGVKLGQPDWAPYSHALALGADVRSAGIKLHFIMNAYWEPLEFELPTPEWDRTWRRWIDTSLDSPNDITAWDDSLLLRTGSYQAGPRSVVVLWSPLTTRLEVRDSASNEAAAVRTEPPAEETRRTRAALVRTIGRRRRAMTSTRTYELVAD